MLPNLSRHDESALKKSALLVATLAAFITPFMGSSINVALPSIGREFAMDAVLLSWVPTAYILAAAILVVPFGRIADMKGRKKVFALGMSIFTVGALLSALSVSATMLIASRALQGVGGAMIFGTGVAILTSVFPPPERGRALGINVAAVYSGLSVGPFAGGFLTEQLGWRSIFALIVPLGLLMVIIVFWKLKGEWADAEETKLDLRGAILYSTALVAIMYGFSQLPHLPAAFLLGAGLIGMVLFVRWELKAESPLVDMDLFRYNRTFAFSNLAALINYSATFAVGFLLSLYLQYIKGYTPQQAGFVLVAQAAVMALGSPFAGKLSDRIQPRIVASIGMGFIVLGLVSFTSLSETTPLWMILAALVLLGVGFALFSSPNTNAVMSSVEKGSYGVAAGAVATMRMTGQMFSLGIVMLIFAVVMGRVQILPEYYGQFLMSLRIAFGIFAALCFGGVFASLARGRVQR
jgi:EmrB/QacA subfamily drug resistance transporter